MTTSTFIAFACLVFVASCTIDFAHTRYVQAVTAGRRHQAAAWSVLQWMAASIGFVVAIRVTMWVLPLEAAGLYVGTLLAVERPKIPKMRVVRGGRPER